MRIVPEMLSFSRQPPITMKKQIQARIFNENDQEIEIVGNYTPAQRGSRDRYGVPMDPDEPDSVEVESAFLDGQEIDLDAEDMKRAELALFEAIAEDWRKNLRGSIPRYKIKAMENEIQELQYVLYCGQQVQLLGVESTEYGVLALICFEDGREDQVPLSRIDYLWWCGNGGRGCGGPARQVTTH